ncbi:MFS transporter [Paenibacillus sp. N1-5-1-14]|uniref:MFS transporter n=1 Tax=Paenibacillus radicibacter TaxID=2972488 RepID=UPI002158D12D|nr:MFS transporter [Paenibacillus radicibacter]MCR8642836.1 MFS transporter [Paenibacillus radicibacter]
MENQVSWKERISYGLGDTASNLIFQVITLYLMFYYTDVFGLDVAAVGTLFLIARIIDALDGPIFGILIDRTNTKWGKSRPWFLWLCIPFAAVAILTFMTPDFSANGKLIYAYVTYILLGILYAGINLPLTSLLSSMTSNSHERTVINTVRMLLAQIGALIVSVGVMPFVAFFGKGNQQAGFQWTMTMFAAIAVVLFLITFKNTRERVQVNGNKPVPFKEGVKAIKGNTPWWLMLVLGVFMWMAMVGKGTALIYFLKYNFGREDLIPVLNGLNILLLVGIAFTPLVSKRLGKRNTLLLGMLIGAVTQVVVFFAEQAISVGLLITANAIGNIGLGLGAGLLFAMLIDTVDYGEWKSGVRAQGLLTAASSFGVKFGMGIGGALTAWILSNGGYVPNATQTESSLNAISFNFIWLPMICFLICSFLLLFYKLDRVEKQMIGDLGAKRSIDIGA